MKNERKITPRMAVDILKKNGTEISEADAEKVMNFIYQFCALALEIKTKKCSKVK